MPLRAAYDDPCHLLHEQNLSEPPQSEQDKRYGVLARDLVARAIALY